MSAREPEAGPIRVDEEFHALCPPLTEEEHAQLEQNLVSAGGARDPIVVWRHLLLDGHNRLEICTRLGLTFRTVEVTGIETREDAKLWIIRNQLGRRNLAPYARIELALAMEPIVAEKAKARQRESGGPVPQKSAEPPIETREVLAKAAGVSHDTLMKGRVIRDRGPKEIKAALREQHLSIDSGYQATTKLEKLEIAARVAALAKIAEGVDWRVAIGEVRRDGVREGLEAVAAREVAEPTGLFDVVVMDPPWPIEKINRHDRPLEEPLPYLVETLEEIAAKPPPCAEDAWVFLWTTQRFLREALDLLDGWGLKYAFTVVWKKPGGTQVYNRPQFNCEFAVCARKGNPIFVDLKGFKTCFEAPRRGHSVKPDEFFQMVRRATAGRRLDMHNRRQIKGFTGWGKESPDSLAALHLADEGERERNRDDDRAALVLDHAAAGAS